MPARPGREPALRDVVVAMTILAAMTASLLGLTVVFHAFG